jgi:hypothetical protein
MRAGTTDHARARPTSITAIAVPEDDAASAQGSPIHAPLGATSDLIALLLMGALGMAVRGSNKNKRSPKESGVFESPKTKPASEPPSEPPVRASAPKRTSVSESSDAISITEPPSSAPPPSVDECASTQTGLDTERLGAIMGIAPLIRLRMARADLFEQVPSHRATAIALSVAEHAADDPRSLRKKQISRTIMWQSLIEHDVFHFPTERIDFPTVTPEQADFFRRAYDNLVDDLTATEGCGLKPGEDAALRSARIERMAQYYLLRRMVTVMTLGNISFDHLTSGDFMVSAAEVQHDLELIAERIRKYYGIEKFCPPDVEGSTIIVNGREVCPWKVAELLKTSPNTIKSYFQSSDGIEIVSEYVKAWEAMSYASQLGYAGGFEEFLAQDMIPNETSLGSAPWYYLSQGLKDRERYALAKERKRLENRKEKLGILPIRRIVRICGRLVHVLHLSERMAAPATRMTRVLRKHRDALERTDPKTWNDLLEKYDGDYHRVLRRLIIRLEAKEEGKKQPPEKPATEESAKKRESSPLESMVVPKDVNIVERGGREPEEADAADDTVVRQFDPTAVVSNKRGA